MLLQSLVYTFSCLKVVLISLGWGSWNGISGSCGDFLFIYLLPDYFPAPFYNPTSSVFCQQRGSISPHLCCHWSFSGFLGLLWWQPSQWYEVVPKLFIDLEIHGVNNPRLQSSPVLLCSSKQVFFFLNLYWNCSLISKVGSLNHLLSKYIQPANTGLHPCQVRRGEGDVRMNKTEDTHHSPLFPLSKAVTACWGPRPGVKWEGDARSGELAESQTAALSCQTPAQGAHTPSSPDPGQGTNTPLVPIQRHRNWSSFPSSTQDSEITSLTPSITIWFSF